MDVKRGAGSSLRCRTLLAAVLLLTGVYVKAESSTASSQSTLGTSLADTNVPTEAPVSTKDTNTMTSSAAVATTLTETTAKTSTKLLEETATSKNDTNTGTTISKMFPTINTNHSSDSTQSTVTPSNTIGVSTNPNTTISVNTTISIYTASESSTVNSSEHTSGPTESSKETVTMIKETGTGSTAQTGNTEFTSNTTRTVTSPSKPVTQEATKSSPTVGSELPPVSKTQTLSEKDTAITDTTEHNVELARALSPGSVAAITVIVIVLVLLIFGGAAYWKIRHSSYGRLLEDQDYGSLGNYNNPLYDDS